MILTPSLIDAIMVAVGAEFILLALFLRRAGAANWILPAFWFLASGALLMAALRLVLSGHSHLITALPLLASFVTHILLLLSVWHRIKKTRSERDLAQFKG